MVTFSYHESSQVINTNIHHHEASRGAGAQSVTAKLTGCGFDPQSRK